MPTALAVAIAILLALALAAPALLAFLRGDVGWRTGIFYGLVGALLLAWYVGFAVGPRPDAAALAPTGGGGAPSGDRCEQALSAAERGGIIRSRTADRLVVNPQVWDQIPVEMRTALTQCAEQLRPSQAEDHPIEVVNRVG